MWKDIKNYENLYKINELGKILSIKFNKILKTGKSTFGYEQLSLSKNNKKKTFRVHRLVAESFIPNVENKKEINHIDGDKFNNRVDNLEWVNRLENMEHAHKLGLVSYKENGTCGGNSNKNKNQKGIIGIVDGEIIFEFDSSYDASRKLGIGRSNISGCCNGRGKSAGIHNGIKIEWRFKEE